MHAKVSELVPPIGIDALVPCGPVAAFDYFTRDIGRWWPLARYSCSMARAANVAIEGRVGGHISETDVDGKRHVWGTVTEWAPGRKVAFTWHPGLPTEVAMVVAITFEAAGESTRVRLVHSGWERLGDDATATRESYAKGWPTVIGQLYKGYCDGERRSEGSS